MPAAGPGLILPALMGGEAAVVSAGIPAFLGAALDSAVIGGLGSAITGQDPLKGALFGGLTGGIGSAILGKGGLGGLFDGGINASADAAAQALPASGGIGSGIGSEVGQGIGFQNTLASPYASSIVPPADAIIPQTANAATPSSGIFDTLTSSKNLPFLLAGGATLLDRMSAPKQVGPDSKEPTEGRPVAPLSREYQDVDPQSYLTSGGNRNFYKPYGMQPIYYSKGGRVQRMAEGGKPLYVMKGEERLPAEWVIQGEGGGKQPSVLAAIANSMMGPSAPAKPTFAPLNRTYTPVDPMTFFHADTAENRMNFKARGGKVRGYENGGSASSGRSTMPVGLGIIKGRGDGRSDSIPAMLSDGEYVFSAPAVSAIGNGSNDAGAAKLDKIHKGVIRKHYKGGKPKKAMGPWGVCSLMDITWVNKGDAERLWPLVEPFLVSALKRWLPVYFSADLLDMVQKDELQLWIITDNADEKLYGAGLTEIRSYPRARIMNIFMLGGKDMKKWKEDWSRAMELFARSQNCDFMQAIGRRGWASFKGAFESAVVVNKVLI